jgi:hypothetical protein
MEDESSGDETMEEQGEVDPFKKFPGISGRFEIEGSLPLYV